MIRTTRKFDNEHGRQIRVEVVVGGSGPGDVRATMTSPDTVDEGFYTRLEAEKLRDALNSALGYGAEMERIFSFAQERFALRGGTGNMSHGDWKGLYDRVLALAGEGK